MRTYRLALVAGLVSAVLAVSPVSASATFVSPTCVISNGNMITGVVLKGNDWLTAPTVAGGPNRDLESRGGSPVIPMNPLPLPGAYTYTFEDAVYPYVAFIAAVGVENYKYVVTRCR